MRCIPSILPILCQEEDKERESHTGLLYCVNCKSQRSQSLSELTKLRHVPARMGCHKNIQERTQQHHTIFPHGPLSPSKQKHGTYPSIHPSSPVNLKPNPSALRTPTLKPFPQPLNIPIPKRRLARPMPSDDKPRQTPLLDGFLARRVARFVGHVVFAENGLFFWEKGWGQGAVSFGKRTCRWRDGEGGEMGEPRSDAGETDTGAHTYRTGRR